MTFSTQKIKEVLDNKGYQFFDKAQPYSLNIIGIRSNSHIINSFDDWLYLIYQNEALALQTHEFAITTDPGTYWLKNPLNVNGTSILVPGQYKDSHQIGLHQGKYKALTQKAPLKIWRDNNQDTTLDKNGKIYEGIFGINIHRSNAVTESFFVEKWSAGCQVFKVAKDFSLFMDICHKSESIYGNSFTYTLLEKQDFNDEPT